MSAPLDPSELADLPGGVRAMKGLADLADGRASIEALWLQMASSRARESNLPVETGDANTHLLLHARLVAADPKSGHATYRALNEELASFLDALEARRRRAMRRSSNGGSSEDAPR